MNLRLALYDWIARYGLDARAGDELFALAGFDAEPAAVARRFWPSVAVLAAALGGFGVVMWIAANWQDFGRMGRFALLEGVLAAFCVAAVFRPAARAPFALAALLCIGGLFAYFGQTYQTGADPWQLFALWALLALPLALGARSDIVWAPWALVASTAISLWLHAHIGHRWDVRSDDLWIHFTAWLACAVLVVFLSKAAQAITGAGVWALRTAGTFTTLLLTFTAITGLLGSRIAPQFPLALAMFAAAAIVLAQRPFFDVFMLSAVALGLDTLLVGGLAHALLERRPDGDVGALLFIAFVAAGVLALSVSLITRIARAHGD